VIAPAPGDAPTVSYREEPLVADSSSSDLAPEPSRPAVQGASRPDTTRMTAAGLAASAACVLLVVYLWTDPGSKTLLVMSGVLSLASAAVSFSLLRARPRARE
jgi:hypothetical protein